MNDQQAQMMGQFLGHVMFWAILLGLGVVAGILIGQRRKPKKFVAWPVIVALLLIVLSVIGGPADEPGPFAASPPRALEAKVQSEKVPAGETPDYEAIRKLIENAITADLKTAFPSEQDTIMVAGKIAIISGRKMVYVAGITGPHLRESVLSGVVNGQLVTVNCIARDAEANARFNGTPCGEAARKALGLQVIDTDL
jgi:hypothetical protein